MINIEINDNEIVRFKLNTYPDEDCTEYKIEELPITSSMINAFISKKGVAQWIRELPDEQLIDLAKNSETKKKSKKSFTTIELELASISYHLLAFSQKNKFIETSLNELLNIKNAFHVMCIIEKIRRTGILNIIENLSSWDINQEISFSPGPKFKQLVQELLNNPKEANHLGFNDKDLIMLKNLLKKMMLKHN